MGVMGSKVVLGVVEGDCGCYGIQGGTRCSRGGDCGCYGIQGGVRCLKG